MITREILITCPGGVHALVAQELAATANSFASSLYLRHEGRATSVGTPIPVLALRLRDGARVTILADGLDEVAALEAVAAVLAPPLFDPQFDPTHPISEDPS